MRLSSPHLPVRPTVGGLMRFVLLALVPGALAMVAVFGIGVLTNIALCVAAALATEAVLLKTRGRAIAHGLSDWTAVLTAVLLALALPPLAPWWIAVVGGSLAIVLGKQLYGGLGNNPFNPAMVGYIVLLISFPTEMTLWTIETASVTNTLAAQFGQLDTAAIDAISEATPLDHLRTQIGQNATVAEALSDRRDGVLAARGWEWINLLYLLGGIVLIVKKKISWRIPAAMLLGLAATALLFWMVDASRFASPVFHLFSGAAMLGAFFIATDPVSGATTPRGQLVFGLGIGVLTYVIRTWGGYPDGVAFAVVLMNLTVPLLDQLLPTTPYGHGKRPER